VIDRYFDVRADCVVLERNPGGDAVGANIRACAAHRGIRVEVVAADAITRHTPGVILVKEVTARRGKDTRAEPIASLYERGRVSHVHGADLAELGVVMATWTPEAGGASPDGLDALVHGVFELAGLGREGTKDLGRRGDRGRNGDAGRGEDGARRPNGGQRHDTDHRHERQRRRAARRLSRLGSDLKHAPYQTILFGRVQS
jgi:hypothetical protein